MSVKNEAISENKKRVSVLVVPSAAHFEDGEETEITAQIIIPEEGGWGWVVMTASFMSLFLSDGIIFTFGTLFADMRDDLKVEETLIVLINSVAFAFRFIGGPIASAIINRYGFRECNMLGSIISMISMLCSHFATSYGMLLFFYGIANGFGTCLIHLSSSLVVGFFFEKLRSIALSISGSGASVGVMVFYTVNSYITELAGWRVTTLFNSGLVGIIYFLAMTYRPLVSFFVSRSEEVAQTVTHLPKFSETAVKKGALSQTTVAERLFRTISSTRYPTAAAMLQEGIVVTPSTELDEAASIAQESTSGPKAAPLASSLDKIKPKKKKESITLTSGTQAGPSRRSTVKLTLTSRSAVNAGQLKQLKSMISTAQVQTDAKKDVDNDVEVTIQIEQAKKRKWWASCCHWEKNTPESRPMYRDDAFYSGKVEKLPVYLKSVQEVPEKSRTGLEYQMAVTRTATAADLDQRNGICTTAFTRIFVSMVDPRLFKRRSFILFCTSAFITYLGMLVPYVFLAERNKDEGILPDHCSKLMSVIGLTNLIGRLILGALACKLDPIKLYGTACVLSGVATIASNWSFSVIYQYICGIVFGFFIASLISLRSMVIVDLYGLDCLTNATGIIFVFQGVGSLIGTPLSSLVKVYFGFTGSFYLAGIFMTVSGLILIPVKLLGKIELKVNESHNTPPQHSK